MMKKFLLILSLFVTTAIISVAQTPGYQGKRWLLSGNFSNMLIIFPGQPNHNYSTNGFPRFNVHYEAELDYCISRRTTMGFMWHRAMTSSAFNYNEYYQQGNTTHSIPSDYDFLRIRGMLYGINFKFFGGRNGGGLAPVGNYFKVGMGMLAYNYMPYDIDKDKYQESYKLKKVTPLFVFSYGKQRILFNALMLRGSIDLGFLPGGVGAAFRSLGSDYDDSYSSARDYALKRLFRYYSLNFNLGIGILIPQKQNK